jgi:hypothetical protein
MIDRIFNFLEQHPGTIAIVLYSVILVNGLVALLHAAMQ